jgi:hypothetical protein
MKKYTVEMRGEFQEVEAASEEEAVLKAMLSKQYIVVKQHTPGCYQVIENLGHGCVEKECAWVSEALTHPCLGQKTLDLCIHPESCIHADHSHGFFKCTIY